MSRCGAVLLKTLMKIRLEFGLPFVQMALALGLLVWDELWQQAMPVRCIPEPSLGLKCLVSIDTPAVLLILWLPHLPSPWSEITVLVAVGMFWYWFALTLASWQERRSVGLFSFVPLRLISDLVPLGVGLLLMYLCGQGLFQSYWPVSWSDWLDFVLLVPPITLSIVLILFFGRDLSRCILEGWRSIGLGLR